MVNINCTGGGGNFQDDVTATMADVVDGHSTLTNESSDEIVAGTMQEITATDRAASAVTDASNLYLRMTNGAHRTNGTTGYPEVYIPLSELRSVIGHTDASKVLTGTTIAGLQGTMTNNGAWSGTLGTSGQITIPAGYHNGQGKIVRPFTLYAPAGAFTPGVSDVTIPTSGKIITSNITCAGAATLIPANIASGVIIFGVSGGMMKYVANTDSTIFSNGNWQNQSRYGMTPVCWCHYSASVSGGSYSTDTSSYLAQSSTNASGAHISNYATYSSGQTLNCTTKWASWQGNDDDEYGYGVVYLRGNQTFNPALYSGIQVIRDFQGSGLTSAGQEMRLMLYDTSGNKVYDSGVTLHPTASYTPWSIINDTHTFAFQSSVYNYQQLRPVFKFRNTTTSASNFTSAIKQIKLLKR